jgi:hypothetical protein
MLEVQRHGAAMTPAPSAGSEAFATVVRRIGPAGVGRVLGCTPGAASNWAAGRRAPGAVVRRAIAKRYAVDVALWDSPPTDRAASRLRQESSAPPSTAREPSRMTNATQSVRQAPRHASAPASRPGDPIGDEAAEAVARDTVNRLRRELDRLDVDTDATSRERASVSTALTSATRLLARLSGALEISQSQILRSPHWQAIQQAVVGALRGNVEALAAVDTALRAFGGSEE